MPVPDNERDFIAAWPDLRQIEAEVWTRLEDAASRARSDWHLPALATVSDSGPEVRTVVLRHADRERRELACHTDARAPKVAQVEQDGRVCWMFYDREHRAQLVIKGTARVHRSDAVADRKWDETPLTSRRCYLAPHAPGAFSEEPTVNLPADLRERTPTEAESDAGREHFCVLMSVVDSIDFLSLHHDGNWRARFIWEGDAWSARYVEP